jgi:hypothetical protein
MATGPKKCAVFFIWFSAEFVQIEMIRDPKEQKELVGVPDEYLSGHAFHFYYLSSPGKT